MSRSIWSAVATLLSPIAISSRCERRAFTSCSSSTSWPPWMARLPRLMWFFCCFVIRSYISCACESRSRSVARFALNSRGRSCVSVMLFRKVSR